MILLYDRPFGVWCVTLVPLSGAGDNWVYCAPTGCNECVWIVPGTLDLT